MDENDNDISDEILESVAAMSESERIAFLGTLPEKTGKELAKLLAADEAVQQKGLLKPVANGKNEIDTPKEIGPYKIVSILGKGGMGTVFEAQQDKPIKRRVALKLINAGMDSNQVIARFEAERQALAMMDHPNIAKVLDAGKTDSGLPYFAMELVQGIPLTDYCDRHRLSTNERLRVFVTVCYAIQHAHQKGIIHRDIKPSNVLVAEDNGTPTPKVIDFGLAKALHTSLTDQTVITQFNQALGTVQYMSPEQTELNAVDIDTRADIYSLGVMMYELLTGSTPIDRETMSKMSLDRILSTIRELEPPTPSSRLSKSNSDTVSSVCNLRGTEPRQLQSILRGDLDWIVMKALEKDRNRRYETANSLAQDVQRFLANDVVLARPPSAGYRLQKFATRNFKAVLAVSALLVVLGATSAISTWQYFKAESARETAQTAKNQADTARIAAEKSEKTVRAQATSVNEIGAFLTEMFAGTRPATLFGIEEERTDNRVRIDRIREDYVDEPAVQADLMYLIGDVYIGMGRIREGAVFAREAQAIREQLFQNSTAETRRETELKLAQSLNQLAVICMYEGRNEEGREIAARARAIHEACFGPTHALTMESLAIRAFGNFQAKFILDSERRLQEGLEKSISEWEAICKLQHQKKDSADRLVNKHFVLAAHYIHLASMRNDSMARLKHSAVAARYTASALAAAGPRMESDKPLKLVRKYSELVFHESFGNMAKIIEESQQAMLLSNELFFGNTENPIGLYAMTYRAQRGIVQDEQPFDSLNQIKQAHVRTYGDVPRTAVAVSGLTRKIVEEYCIDPDKNLSEEQRQLAFSNHNYAINTMTKCLGDRHYKVGQCHLNLALDLCRYHRVRNRMDSPAMDLAEKHFFESLKCFSHSNTIGYRMLDVESCLYLIEIAVAKNKATADHLRPVLDHLVIWNEMEPDAPNMPFTIKDLPDDLKAIVLGSGKSEK